MVGSFTAYIEVCDADVSGSLRRSTLRASTTHNPSRAGGATRVSPQHSHSVRPKADALSLVGIVVLGLEILG